MNGAVPTVGRSWRWGAVIVGLMVTVGVMAFVRLIDGDEGFFLVAARMVSEGKALYHDFFFIHAPMVPYLFGAWFKLLAPGWYWARALCALIAIGVGLLVFGQARRSTGQWVWAFVAAGLYAGSGFVLGWFTVAKTLGLSCLFLFAGTAVLTTRHRYASAAGGVLLGLAASTRLYLLVSVACAAVYLLRRERAVRPGARELGLLLVGVLLGMLPLAVNLIRDAPAFLFGTVEYHALRDLHHAGVVGNWPQKWATLLSAFGLEDADGTGSLQFLGLVTGGLAAVVSPATPRNSPFACNWMVLLAVSILPTPSYQQYFSLLIPFLALEVVTLLATIGFDKMRLLLVTGLAVYGVLGFLDARRFAVVGTGVPGVLSRDRALRWSIPLARQVSRAVDELNQPVGASWWPGYFVGSRTPLRPELVNDFGMVVADRVNPERRKRFHICTRGEVTEMIHAHDPPLFVEGNWAFTPSVAQLSSSGYKLAREVGPVRIWTHAP